MTTSTKIPVIQGPFIVKVGYYDRDATPQLKELAVSDLRGASKVCVEYIDNRWLGASYWAGGEVLHADTRECVAVVGYNGRVWAPGGTNPEGIRIEDLAREFDLT